MRRALSLALLSATVLALVPLLRSKTEPAPSLVVTPEVRAILEGERPRKGPDQLEWLYTVANFPYGAVLPVDIYQDMLADQAQTPDESQYSPGGQRRIAIDDWEFVGPQGMPVRGKSEIYSGRITDLDFKSTTGIRVGAANGGLWQFDGGAPFPIADLVNPLTVGSFDTSPADDGRIALGTGEPDIRGGSGFWLTTDGGSNWVQVATTTTPAEVYRLRFSPWKDNEVHAATSAGHYRSDTSGSSWTRKRAARCTDIAFDPDATGDAYAAFFGSGIFKTGNSGDSWVKLTGTALPDSTVIGRTSLAVAPSAPQQVWALIAEPTTPKQLTHLLKSTDGGATWTDVGLPSGFALSAGWYNQILSVHPMDPDTVLLGGVELWRTTNGGNDWNQVPGIHPDGHAIAWSSDGSKAWVGNDGGLYESTDGGATFTTPNNVLPITQYQSIDVCSLDPQLVIGGTQDNGYNHTTNLVDWEVSQTGDGGRALLKPGVCGISWVGMGVYDGPKSWKRFRSTDYFATYQETENGIYFNTTWYPDISIEPVSGNLHTHGDENVFFSTDDGSTWNLLHPTGFANNVASVTAERGLYGAVYVTTTSEVSGSRVHVYKDGIWTNRDSGLPAAGYIRRVAPHPTVAGTAYLIVSNLGASDASPRVYTTTDWGATWTPSETGLGRIAPLDITSHPDDPNQIFLGTTTGMRWSPNGGTSWFTWSAGMPAAVEVWDFAWTAVPGGAPGEWWLYGGSFGRGIWRRKVGTESVVGPVSASQSIVAAPDRNILAQPDGSGATLADAGGTIEVQVLDSSSTPIAGIPANQIWLRAPAGTAFDWCTLPYRADGPTDFSGRTTFSGPLPASGRTASLQVVVDGVVLGTSVGHDIRSTDINKDFVVDICDLVDFEKDADTWFDTGVAPPRSDLDFDGDVDLADKDRLSLAINVPTSCRSSGIALSTPEGTLGVWFDQAGTQFGQLVQSGNEFEFYVIARGFTEGVRGLEFSLPALLDPAIEVLQTTFLTSRSTADERTGPYEYRFLIPPDCAVLGEIPILKIRARLETTVDELRICPAPLAPSSFPGAEDVPGWITCDDPCQRVPFAAVSCGVINPFGSAIWSGLIVEALAPAVITLLEDRIDLGGLGASAAGMRIDLTGAGPAALPRGLSDAAGVDGMGLQFLSSLPVANLPAGATVEIRANGSADQPLAGILGTAEGSNGPMDFQFVGDPAYRGTELALSYQGQTVLQLSGFDRNWKSSEGLPGTFAVLHNGGELVMLQEWTNGATIEVDEQQYLVDEMQLLTSTSGSVPEGLFWSGYVGGSSIPNVQIGWQGVERFGQGYLFAQNAYLKSLQDRMELVRMDWSQPGQVRLESIDDLPLTLHMSGPPPAVYPDGVVSMDFQSRDGNESLGWIVSNVDGGVKISVDDTGIGNPGWIARGSLQGNQQWEYQGTAQHVIDVSNVLLTTTATLDAIVTRPPAATGGAAPDEVGGGPLSTIDELQVLFPGAQVFPDGKVVQLSFQGTPVVRFYGAPVLIAAPPDQRPTRTALLPNLPNPFNPSTQVRFELARPGPVRVRIYDVRGRLVRTLVDGFRDAGVWDEEWSGRDDDGRSVASGVYHVQLVTQEGAESRKIALVK